MQSSDETIDTLYQSYWKAVTDACKTGDGASLRHLLRDKHAPTYETGQDIPLSDRRLITDNMLVPAIENQQAEMVAIILHAYTKLSIWSEHVLLAATGENSDLSTFKALYAHNPEIGEYSFQHHTSTLVEVCSKGDTAVAEFLLDCNVDPNEGGWPGQNPLYHAVRYGKPISLIKKLVLKGAHTYDSAIMAAYQEKRYDVLEYLLEISQLDHPDWLISAAQKDNNERAVEMIQAYIDKRSGKKKPKRWQFWKK